MKILDGMVAASKMVSDIFSDDRGPDPMGLVHGLFPTTTGDAPSRGTRNFLNAYRTMPWVRALASRTSDGVASVGWCIYVVRKSGQVQRMKSAQHAGRESRIKLLDQLRGEGELERIYDHPLLSMLEGGNGYLSGHMVRRITQLHLDLVGDAFWIKERNALGVPIAAWPLAPDWVAETPTPSRPSYRVSIRGWDGQIPESDILWFCNPDPANPYGRGTGLTEALGDELETDEYAAKHVKQTFLNRARPDLVIWPRGDGRLSMSDTERLERGWLDRTQGFWKALKPMFLPQAVEIKDLAPNFQHLQLTELRRYERDMCIQVYGFPPEILGVVNESKRSTVVAADFHFSRWVLTPRLEQWRSNIQNKLVPDYDSNLIVDYVSPIEEDREFQAMAMNQTPWAFSVNEHRALAGLSALDDLSGDERLGPATLFPMDATGQKYKLQNLSVEDLIQLRAIAEKSQ